MAKKNDPNKKHYFNPIKDAEEKKKLLEWLVEEEATIVLWRKGKEKESEQFNLTGLDEEAPNALLLSPSSNLLRKFLSSPLTDRHVLLKATVEKYHYFTDGVLRKIPEKKSYKFEIRGTIFKSQQRSDYRLTANKFVSIQFKVNGQVHKALDVSAGGTSFMVDIAEAEKFTKGTVFADCLLGLNGARFTIPKAKIVVTWDNTVNPDVPKDKLKVGIAFQDMPTETDENLAQKINSEARGLEVRKLLL